MVSFWAIGSFVRSLVSNDPRSDVVRSSIEKDKKNAKWSLLRRKAMLSESAFFGITHVFLSKEIIINPCCITMSMIRNHDRT